VLGCAGLVAAHPGALVVSVTAGRPGPHPLTEWDRRCGFSEGDDVVGRRRQEDEIALEHLGASALWLDFLDRQYADGKPPERDDVAAAIRAAVDGVELVASPLGLEHPDHLVTAQACFDVARSLPSVRWIIYEDAIYRSTPGAMEEVVSRLADAGYSLRPLQVESADAKRAAVTCYASQVHGLGGLLDDAYQPERYWDLVIK